MTVSGREWEWDLVPRGTRNVCDVYRSILGKVVLPLSLSLLSFLCLVVVSVCMSSCDVRPLLGHTICQKFCVCVCSQSIFAEPAAVHLLDGFPLFTVYCLRFIGSPTCSLWHFDVDVAGHRTLLRFCLLLLLFLCSTLTFIMLVVLSGT